MKNTFALINGCVYTGDAILRKHAVMIENGKITGTPSLSYVPKGLQTVDLNGGIVAPGFIDAQVNGGGGVLFNDDPTPEALATIAKAHERYGTLHWCPTVITASLDTMEQCLKAVKASMGAGIGVIGTHLEGPYLSNARPGVHDTEFIRPATSGEIHRLLTTGQGAISLVTVAPESAGEAYIKLFTDADIQVFLGHTDAPCVIAEAAFAAGVTGVTHLYNAMSQMTGREPGVVGAALSMNSIWAGIIADGIHVDWLSVKLAKGLKKKRLFLVTDAMPPVGKPDAVYTIGGKEIVCKDGRCATADGTLAGSALDMATAVRNCVDHCGIELDEALRMASAYPAEMLGVANRLGYIRPGYEADLVFLDEGVNVTGIMRGGKKVAFTPQP
ncbi:MAG: N-acetylglucosamine-6-phosphate deacetylase [Oscillospiraceae bacterium]|jgi:N-acetylglucosamine-6-phosphate deacetylase|nr:N-acetylglucosamine-6-phosphate deacetylase [Oscillospiraceae bacterium]